MASQKKQIILDQIVIFLKKNLNFTIIKFDKTKHTSLETLRKELKKSGSNVKVVKNSIFEKAILKLSGENKDIKEFNSKISDLKDSTAIIGLGSDWSKGLSAFYNFIKKETTLSFKLGILDSQIYTSEVLTKIAQLPPKEELLGKIIGSLKSPISKTVYSLKFNTNKLVYILKERAKQAN